jgi:hypothetical protein
VSTFRPSANYPEVSDNGAPKTEKPGVPMKSPDWVDDLSVRVKKPLNTPLSTLMSDMRTWLDHQGIQPINFKPITLDSGLAFDVSFRHPQQAEFFRAVFDPQPTR